jgi:hypothetical protein
MSRVMKPALRGTLLGRTLRFLNPLIRRLLASRLHWPLSRWLALLRWTPSHRRRSRTLPVSYVCEGSSVYLTTGDRWAADFARPAPVAIRVRGRWYPRAEAVSADQEEAAVTLRRLFGTHSWFRVLSGIPSSSSGGANPRAVDMALRAGRVLIRVRLTPGRAASASAREGTLTSSGI